MAVRDFDWLGKATDKLRENLRAKAGTEVEQTIADWIEERIEFAQDILKEDGKSESGSLIPSIRPDTILKDSGVFVKILAEDYWDFVNSGVDGFEQKGKAINNTFGSKYSFRNLNVSREMITSLKSWVQRKGITQLGNKKIVISENVDIETSIAFSIAKNIKKRGLDSVPYMDKAFGDEAIKDLAKRIGKSVTKIMQTNF
tara:strand:- start:599 stop:1198 length:600 start_codon:yes stop_codon:yes gene_type:complete